MALKGMDEEQQPTLLFVMGECNKRHSRPQLLESKLGLDENTDLLSELSRYVFLALSGDDCFYCVGLLRRLKTMDKKASYTASDNNNQKMLAIIMLHILRETGKFPL